MTKMGDYDFDFELTDPNAALKLRPGEMIRNRKHPEWGTCKIDEIRFDLVDVSEPGGRPHRWLIGDVERAEATR